MTACGTASRRFARQVVAALTISGLVLSGCGGDDSGGDGSGDQEPPEPSEGIFHYGDQLFEVNGHDRHQGTHVQHRVQKQSRLIQTEQMASQVKVSRAAYRQKFRQALDDAQYRRFQPIHSTRSFHRDCRIRDASPNLIYCKKDKILLTDFLKSSPAGSIPKKMDFFLSMKDFQPI